MAYIGDFEARITMLRESGYHPLFYRDLAAYVYHGAELPENPIVITMDDGYQSDLDLGVPVLEREGFCATIAVIGCSVGKDTYKNTGTPINPHFALEDAAPYVESGVLDIQTHSYDIHQVKKLDGEDCRFGVLRMSGETELDYVDTLTANFLRSKEQIESALDVDCNVYTYPYGVCDTLSESVLHGLGIQVSVTVDPGVNEIVKGLPQSLYQLKRINVAGGRARRSCWTLWQAIGPEIDMRTQRETGTFMPVFFLCLRAYRNSPNRISMPISKARSQGKR